MSPAVSPVFHQDSVASLAHLLAISLEFVLYGVYAALFAASIEILRRRTVKSQSGQVFFYASLLLFFVATLHICINFPRIVKAYALESAGPVAYLNDTSQWENFLHYLLLSVMITLGDLLVAYRCYIIWACNPYVVILPLLMIMASTGVSITILVVLRRPTTLPAQPTLHLVDSIYPLNFAQNTLTTGLIALRLYLNHRQSKATKASPNHRGSFLEALKIVVESAFMYTAELFFLIILNARRNVFMIVLINALIPTIGIVFTLIAVRIYLASMHGERAAARSSQPLSRPVAFRVVGLTSTPLAGISEEDEFAETNTSFSLQQLGQRHEAEETKSRPDLPS